MGNKQSKAFLISKRANNGNSVQDGNSRVASKRTAEDMCGSSSNRDEELETEHSPGRKRLRTTSEYIYNVLFLEGENSDVTISALGHEWKLHKVYLCQSGYFRGMLKGQWLESSLSFIAIEIPDETVDRKALDIAFGSLYSDEVDVNILRSHVIPTLAAARLLDLTGLLVVCQDVMMETLSASTVCRYHQAACTYALTEVERKCFQWIERNLLLCRTPAVAKEISQDVLEQVLQSMEFVVMQVEVDVYNFLKIWVYLKLHPTCDLPLKSIVQETQRFFIEREQEENKRAFLATEEGLQFASTFKCLKLERLLEDSKAINLLKKDGIIPKEWLLSLYEEQWNRMLNVYNGSDQGPIEVPRDVFEKFACRCGRILEKNSRYCWRWTGFSCGIDIIVTYDNRNRSLSIKRNTYSQPCNSAICMQSQRAVALRFKLFTTNDSGAEVNCKDTGLLHMMLKTDEEAPLFQLNENWTFPVFVSARIMIASHDVNGQKV
ncbi:germ cell-less protein-like 1 [Rhopilema esculentum]|uniref:germ cell-less protein-like 1 n=1 Tax=Rhopilema esculentum TaxID=499914 RepID=UPI0031D341A3